MRILKERRLSGRRERQLEEARGLYQFCAQSPWNGRPST